MKPELLAPAGSPESLAAALSAGADAVYFGAHSFNARKNANNFTEDELKQAVRDCRLYGVKTNIVLNTQLYGNELAPAIALTEQLLSFGADAFIVADIGLAKELLRIFPGIELHASTQCTGQNALSAKALAEIGFKRMVAPRELPLRDIQTLCKNSPIETETFIHGALCVSHSGQCLMSSIIGGRSGNRGECAQPCRLDFRFGEKDHALSLKDMSHIEYIRELASAGVCSFKIEGRMKRPEYVSAVVSACKKSLNDTYTSLVRKDLSDLFSRSGFTDGYYNDELGREMFGFREKENVQSATKELLSKYASLYEKEQPRFGVHFNFSGKIGEKAILTATCNGQTVSVESEMLCEAPINRPISIERIHDALNKCGGTQFTAENVEIKGEVDYSLPVSANLSI